MLFFLLWRPNSKDVIKRFGTLTKDDTITILQHFSNQFEGSPELYFKFEHFSKSSFKDMSLPLLVRTTQIFFNTKQGTILFMKQLLVRVFSLLDSETTNLKGYYNKISI